MTVRGWVVIGALTAAAVIGVNWLLRDICWYGPCAWAH